MTLSMRFPRTVVLALALMLELASPPAIAQIGGSGSIRGTVLDTSGAILPGATITATNTATGIATSRQSTEAGAYVISPLPPGDYRLAILRRAETG